MRVLVVDDNDDDRYACRRSLSKGAWEVVEAATPDAAIGHLDEGSFDLVLCDYNLKAARDGIDVLERARALQPEALRVLMSGYADGSVVEEARRRAAIRGFVDKPDSPGGWLAALERVLADAGIADVPVQPGGSGRGAPLGATRGWRSSGP